MPTKRPPKDANQLAKYILDVSTGEAEKFEPPKKNPAAVALSALGASKVEKLGQRVYHQRRAERLPRKRPKRDGQK